MAQVAGTYSSYDIVGARESLMDKIFILAREETPFMSNGKSGKASARYEEWQTDDLEAAADNAQIEGDEFAFTAPTPTVRVGNITQIASKTIRTTRTADQVDKAGRATELGFQMMKKMKSLKRDMEKALLNNQASVAGNDTTARKLGGLPAWLTSNVSRGAAGVNGGFSAGIVAAATDGTQRAFTEALLKAVHKSAWDNGGRPKLLYTNSTQKQAFSGFAGIAVNRVNQSGTSQASIVGAADMYVGDFGNITSVLSPQQRQREVFLVDPQHYEVRYIQKPKVETLAKTGDADSRAIVTEFTLVVTNQKAHGVVADLT